MRKREKGVGGRQRKRVSEKMGDERKKETQREREREREKERERVRC